VSYGSLAAGCLRLRPGQRRLRLRPGPPAAGRPTPSGSSVVGPGPETRTARRSCARTAPTGGGRSRYRSPWGDNSARGGPPRGPAVPCGPMNRPSGAGSCRGGVNSPTARPAVRKWSRPDSNRRPPACDAARLPLRYGTPRRTCQEAGFEPACSRLSDGATALALRPGIGAEPSGRSGLPPALFRFLRTGHGSGPGSGPGPVPGSVRPAGSAARTGRRTRWAAQPSCR
jgi:hypothetical protein